MSNTIKQLSIFIENKPGRLAQVTEVLSRNNINIYALSLADTVDFGVLRMIVDKTDEAKNVLKQAGITASATSVIAVEVPHRPGGLNEILQMFHKNGVDVEYMYAFVHIGKNSAVMIFRCKSEETAVAKLLENNFTVMDEANIYG